MGGLGARWRLRSRAHPRGDQGEIPDCQRCQRDNDNGAPPSDFGKLCDHVHISLFHLSALNVTDPDIPGNNRPSVLGKSISMRIKRVSGLMSAPTRETFASNCLLGKASTWTVTGAPTLIARTLRSGASTTM